MIALLVAAAFLPGFNRTPSLESAASFVAGKPVTVYCAKSTPAWRAFMAENYPAGVSANSSTAPGSAEIWLSVDLCRGFRLLWGTSEPLLGVAILGLTHEAIHDRGERNEGVTDCSAVHEMPRVAVKFFGVRPGKQLRALMAAVWAYRAKEPPPYRSVC